MCADVSGWTTRLTQADIERHTASGAWRNLTLADRAREAAQRFPERIAVVEGERAMRFGEIYAAAQRLARALRASGLQRGDVVSFQLPNWCETMVLNLAACLGGLVVNPIVPIYRESEVRYILQDARSRAFFVPQAFAGSTIPRWRSGCVQRSRRSRKWSWCAGRRTAARPGRACSTARARKAWRRQTRMR
jgi:non-ribosomal peptide synthetase component E (peptide arylation enzyme)